MDEDVEIEVVAREDEDSEGSGMDSEHSE